MLLTDPPFLHYSIPPSLSPSYSFLHSSISPSLSDPILQLLFYHLYSALLRSAFLCSALLYSTLLYSNPTILHPFNHTAVVADEMKELERQLAEKKSKFEDLLVELEIVNEKYGV